MDKALCINITEVASIDFGWVPVFRIIDIAEHGIAAKHQFVIHNGQLTIWQDSSTAACLIGYRRIEADNRCTF